MPRNDPWTKREIFLIGTLTAKGVSDALIASRIRRSKNAVRIKQHELGLRNQRKKIERPPVLGARPRGLNAPKTKIRPCMCCGGAFRSEGPHHRLCGNCRHNSVSPYAL